MGDIVLFLRETDHIDKLYVLLILILLFIGLAVALKWMSKKGIGFKIGGFQLTPNLIKEIEKAEEFDKKLENIKAPKLTKEVQNELDHMNRDLTNIVEETVNSNVKITKEVEIKIEALETQIDDLSRDIEIKEAEIVRLEQTINKYTLDKTVDYKSFESCLEEIMNEYFEIMKGVCYTFENDLNFSQISDDEYNKLIKENTIKFLKQSREILKSKFSGEIVDDINNLYSILTTKEEKKFENNYKSLYYSLRDLSFERESIKHKVLEKTGQQITSAFVNWKRTLIPRMETMDKSNGSLDVTKKLNYLLQKEDILNLVATISSIYNTYKDQDKTNIFKKQIELVEMFKTDFSYMIKINFEKYLIKTVEENDIDITQHYVKE